MTPDTDTAPGPAEGDMRERTGKFDRPRAGGPAPARRAVSL
ncbi:hypothetical protein ABZW32_03055 [Streptomyces sp. NPDC004667]